ncbi:AEC family transporter [Clostridium sp. DL1XJH146]
MNKFIFSLSLIIIGLLIGYILQIFIKNKWITIPLTTEKLTRNMQKVALLFLNPIALVGALWIVNLNSIKLMVLPFLGFFALILGGITAFIFGKLQKLNRKQMGAYVISGSFTNLGTIGGLICFTFFGEVGYALVPLYKLFEELTYYGIGFPIAKAYSGASSERESLWTRLKNVFSDVFIIVAFLSISIGLILNFLSVDRPKFYSELNSIVIPLMTIILLASIGLNLKFNNMGKYIKPSLLIVIIKIVIVPVTITILAYILGLEEINDGLPLKVALVLASMPTGFIAMVPPTIYDLDSDLAYTVWIATNASLIITIPILGIITKF